MGSLRMPKHLREELSSGAFGTLLRGTPSENVAKAKEIIASTKPKRVIAVGDFTLKLLINAGSIPDLGIFDRRTRRIFSDFPAIETATVQNPAGEITDAAISLIKNALLPGRKKKVMLMVEGEEDLLSLPAIVHAPLGSLVIYGLPDQGMMVITADRETKKKIESVIEQFQKID